MNGVIIVAVLSCMNSGIYVCSRVLVALAEKGEAPAFLATHDRRGVPTRAILIGSLSGSMAVMASVLSAERLFAMLVNATGMRSEEHTSELQSLRRISYAVFCLKKKKQTRQEY